ncbi:dentin sialophosphoprotein-like [Ptychodera flava]|uniref:dentin sialophosphoprotein-like n=1 Tax=Ptychodera flava TaxID=63121 RepID=UPI003969DF39
MANVTAYDQGEYHCSMKVKWSLPSDLIVLVPPEQDYPNCSLSGASSQLIEGENVTLFCQSRGGKPRPELSWMTLPVQVAYTPSTAGSRDSDTITAEITLSRNYNGVSFVCIAASPALPNARNCSVGPLDVKYRPTVVVSPLSVTVSPGGGALFTCAVDANPLPRPDQVDWIVDAGKQETGNITVRIVNGTVSEIFIASIERELNNSKVTCNVTNSVGTDSAHGIVIVKATNGTSDEEPPDETTVYKVIGTIIAISTAAVIVCCVVCVAIVQLLRKCAGSKKFYFQRPTEGESGLICNYDGFKFYDFANSQNVTEESRRQAIQMDGLENMTSANSTTIVAPSTVVDTHQYESVEDAVSTNKVSEEKQTESTRDEICRARVDENESGPHDSTGSKSEEEITISDATDTEIQSEAPQCDVVNEARTTALLNGANGIGDAAPCGDMDTQKLSEPPYYVLVPESSDEESESEEQVAELDVNSTASSEPPTSPESHHYYTIDDAITGNMAPERQRGEMTGELERPSLHYAYAYVDGRENSLSRMEDGLTVEPLNLASFDRPPVLGADDTDVAPRRKAFVNPYETVDITAKPPAPDLEDDELCNSATNNTHGDEPPSDVSLYDNIVGDSSNRNMKSSVSHGDHEYDLAEHGNLETGNTNSSKTNSLETSADESRDIDMNSQSPDSEESEDSDDVELTMDLDSMANDRSERAENIYSTDGDARSL